MELVSSVQKASRPTEKDPMKSISIATPSATRAAPRAANENGTGPTYTMASAAPMARVVAKRSSRSPRYIDSR